MFLAIDLGGTNTRVASSKDLKNIYKIEKFKTCKNLEEQKQAVAEAIQKVVETSGDDNEIKAICLGVPGIVDKKEERFGHIVNFPSLNGRKYHELFELYLANTPIIAVNDASLAGLGEAVRGAAKDFETMAYITISTGVGGVRISQKTLDLTMRFSEPGHHIIDIGGAIDTKVHLHGTLEAYVSGAAFVRNYGERPESCEDMEVWEDYGQKLANGMINVCAFWSPECVVIGGGISNQFDKFKNSLVKNFQNQDFFEMPVFKKVELGDEAGVYGGLSLLKQAGY